MRTCCSRKCGGTRTLSPPDLLAGRAEVGVSLLMVPVWFYLGAKHSLPWMWYLRVPALLWVAGFMLADRMRFRPYSSEPGESLSQRVESSLAQVEHQIWLLRNVLWWYLLPPGLAILAFFGQCAWEARSGGWWVAAVITGWSRWKPLFSAAFTG